MRLPAALILCWFTGVLAQGVPPPPPPAPGQPPRDALRRPEPAGTGVIRGRVVAADTGNPIRRASVTLAPARPLQSAGGSGGRGAGPRQAMTNVQGFFEFTGLPAGSYRVLAFGSQYLPQYLGMAYGAKKPSGPFSSDTGQSISLTDGQTFEKAVLALPRGAVITGRVTDENAEPLARVQVYAVFYPPGSPRGRRIGSGAQTDDLGQFRVYGLVAGDYVIGAEARENTSVQPNAPQETEDEKIGFLTTYYPGTTDEAAAQRVRAQLGSETPGIEIRLGQGRLFRVSGLVTDSQGRSAPRVVGQLTRRVPGFNGGSSVGFSTDEQGQFQMRNIPPGSYRLLVQQMRPNVGPTGPGSQADPGEMANVPLTVATDLDNVAVTTVPGTTITGQVVIEQGAPSPSPRAIRVLAAIGDSEDTMGMRPPQPVLVGPDLTFTMKGLMGEYLLRVAAPNLYVKSIAVGAEDVTDTPREFKPNDRVVITLTSRASTLEGSVADGRGPASTDTGVVVFSEDRESWRTSSTRTGRAVVDAEGHFRVGGLMPGRYLVVALPRERLTLVPGTADAAFFEQLSKDAVPVVIGEDEQRKIDLKVVEGSGGR